MVNDADCKKCTYITKPHRVHQKSLKFGKSVTIFNSIFYEKLVNVSIFIYSIVSTDEIGKKLHNSNYRYIKKSSLSTIGCTVFIHHYFKQLQE